MSEQINFEQWSLQSLGQMAGIFAKSADKDAIREILMRYHNLWATELRNRTEQTSALDQLVRQLNSLPVEK